MSFATRKSAHEAWIWLSLIPIAGITGLAWFCLAPRLVLPINPEEIKRLFVSDKIWQCAPEQLEQLRYLLLISLGPLLFWLGFVMRGFLGKFWSFSFSKKPMVHWAALMVQLSLVLFVYKNWAFQNALVHPYVNRWYIPRTLLIEALGGAIGAGVLGVIAARISRSFPRISLTALPIVLAALLTLLALVPSFAIESNLFAQHADTYHMPFTMDEFAAVLNGRTIWVDFFPQYQSVLPYLLAPLFMLVGLSVTTYTLAMVLLGWISLVCIFWVFVQLSNSRWIGLMAYSLWLALAFFPSWPRGTWHETIFTYFQVGPLRYFAPFILALLTFCSLIRGSRRLYFLTFVIGTLGALNNADFGLPALAGAYAALFLTRPDRLKISITFALGLVSATAAYFLFTYFRSGFFPLFQDIIAYQRAFAIYGFCMIPMPPLGLHWIVSATHLAAIFTGVAMIFAPKTEPGAPPNFLAGMLVFAGFFGCGNLMYYVGRSHWAVLISCFPAWGLSLALLAIHQLQDWKSMNRKLTDPLQILPKAFLVLTALLLVPQLANFPSPIEQLQRLRRQDPSFSVRQQEMVELIQKYTKPGDKTAVIYPWGHRLASLAGVENVFPFAQDESLILNAQLEKTYSAIEKNHVSSVFGLFPQEITDWLTKSSFRRQEALKSGFAVWTNARFLTGNRLREPQVYSSVPRL